MGKPINSRTPGIAVPTPKMEVPDPTDPEGHGEDVEIQNMDNLNNCIVGSEPSIQQVLNKMKALEAQLAPCLAAQPLLYQVFAKCNTLEQRLKTMEKEFDRRFTNFTNALRGHEGSSSNHSPIPVPNPVPSTVSSPKRRQRLQKVALAPCPSVQHPQKNGSDADVPGGQDGDQDDNDLDPDWQPEPDNNDNDIQGDENEEEINDSAEDDNDIEIHTSEVDREPQMSLGTGRNQLSNAKTAITYQCKVCPHQIGFKALEDLAKHYTKHHPITQTGTTGIVTSLATKSSTSARRTSSLTKPSTRSRNQPDKSSSCSEVPTHVCSKCPRTFQTLTQLKLHTISAHQVIKCHICQEEFLRKADLRAHKMNVHGGDTFPCPEGCGKVFRNGGTLKRHLPACRGGPQRCDECGETFTRARNLRDHKKGVHQGLKPDVCSVCGKTFGIGGLKKHMRAIHVEEDQRRRHFCETCGKGFMTERDLENHRRTHTGERPFACEDCGKTFGSRSTLRGHRVLHTGKPHVCDLCGWGFARRIYLVRHKIAHGRGTAREGAHKGSRRSAIVGYVDANGTVTTNKPASGDQ